MADDAIDKFLTAPVVPTQPDIMADQIGERIKNRLARDEFHETFVDPLRAAMGTRKERYEAANIAGGRPLDIQTGAPIGERMHAAFLSDPEAMMKYWQDQYGADKVRLSTDGVPIVTTTEEKTGKSLDLRVTPEDLHLSDVPLLLKEAPQVLGTILGMKGMQALLPLAKSGKFLKGARSVIGTSLGMEGEGVLQDVASRMAEGLPANVTQLSIRHAEQLPLDAATATAMGFGGAVLGRIATPFMGEMPPVQFDARQGTAFFKRNHGIDLEPLFSAGELTGSPFLQRSEVLVQKSPAGAGFFERQRQGFAAAIQQIQNIIAGLPKNPTAQDRMAVPSIEDVGERVASVLQEANEPAETAILGARERAVQAAHRNILLSMDKASLPERLLQDYGPVQVGQSFIDRAKAKLADFTAKSKTLYDAAYALPGGTDRALAPSSLSSRAAEALKDLPSKDMVSEVKSPILDAQGNAIKIVIHGREVLKEFVPTEVIPKLQKLSELGTTKFSLRDLVQMRNEVSNDIARGEAVPGTQTHHLNKIREMLTDAIHEGTASIGDPRLRQAWEKANNFYRDEVGQFHRPGIAPLLKNPGDPGYIGPAQVTGRLTAESPATTDLFNDMKDFVGVNSPEMKLLKRRILDRLYQTSLQDGTDVLDAKSFLGKLSEFYSKQPEMAKEVFGKQGADMIRQAKSLLAIGEPKISASELDKSLQDPRKFPDLFALIRAQSEKEKLYRNSILKMVGSKSVPSDFNPNDFVNYFLNKASPKEAAEIMKIIHRNPMMEQELRAKVASSILDKAERQPMPQDRVATRLDPQRMVSSFSLQKLLEDESRGPVYREILGDEGMENLLNLARVLRPGEAKERAFASAGGIAAGMVVSGFYQGKIGKFVDKSLHNYVGGFLLTTPGVKRWTGNTAMTPQRTYALMNTLMASTPVIDSMLRDYGAQGAVRMTGILKANLDESMREKMQAGAQSTNRVTTAQILKFLNQ